MDVRTPLFQNIASVLIGVLFLNPIVGAAAELAVAAGSNTSLTQAGNGVPIVNIATPNGNGLSHNKFTDYNVGQQGLILNNATAKTQATQLGGLILGNAKLNGSAAKLILNEVNGANPSQLKGYTEVAGQGAHVVVANPHGITCNGCGFINTPRVTLSTGKPLIESGRLDRFDVDGGQISIEGAGLNASNVDQFDLITRSAKLNAELHAKQLNVITGRNQVKADDLAVTAKAADGSEKPQLAIDSSALGGMYAGAIRLVGTEAGVGVKLAGNLAASAGDIRIDANGQLSLAQAVASGSMHVNAQSAELTGTTYAAGNISMQTSGELSSSQSLAAAGRIELQGGQIVNSGLIEAGVNADNSRNAVGDLRIDSQTLRNSGTLVGSRQLAIDAAQLLDNRGGTLSGKAQAQIQAGQLDNRQGRVLSQGDLNVQANSLNNSQDGLITSKNSLTLQAGSLNNQDGEVSSLGSATISGSDLDNRNGTLIGENALHIDASTRLSNGQGVISSTKDLNVQAGSLDNSGGGVLVSAGDLQVTVQNELDNHAEGTLAAQGELRVTSGSLDNSDQGLLSSGGRLQLNSGALNNSQAGALISQGELDANTANIDNQGGVISSQQALQLTAGDIDNSQAGLITSAAGLTLTASTLDSSAAGELSAKGDLSLTVAQLIQLQGRLIGEAGVSLDLLGGDLDNRGGLISVGGPLTLVNLGTLDNRDQGELSVDQSFSLTARRIDNGEKGRIISSGVLSIESDELRNSGEGLLSGWQGLSVKGGSLDNSARGSLSSRDGKLAVELSGALNNSAQGALVSKGDQRIVAASLNNRDQGILSSDGTLALELAGKLDNQAAGLVSAQGDLTISAQEVDNRGGQIVTEQTLLLSGTSLDNSGGMLSSAGAMSLILSGALSNANQAQLASGGDLLLQAGSVDNRGGKLVSQGLLKLTAGSLNNASGGTLAAHRALVIALSGALDNGQDGLIYSLDDSLAIAAQSIVNDAGTLQSKGDLNLVTTVALTNQGGRIVGDAGNLQIQAGVLDNSAGGILNSVSGWLRLVIGGLFNNNAGTTQAQSLQIASGDLNNAAGHLSALSGDSRITAAAVDNQGGGLYAHGLLDLDASSLANQNGQVAAGQVDFGLSGALNNRNGIIESSSNLTLAVGSLDNQGGSLRALGTTGITRISGGLLDNRGGLIETANTALQLDVSGLQNGGGLIQHIGTGTFGLSAANVMAAGGTLSSNGLLDITATSWVNSSVLQAGTLVLNIGSFTQTASGQLLASQSFTGSGGTWVNHGLLASDGDFSLTLSGGYSGNGRLTSIEGLSLKAASIDLPTTARISGGGLTTVTSTGLLTNRGKLTSAADLTVRAATLNNYGTLGSAEQLRLYAPTLLNQNGLIFSGDDMALRVDNFTNTYADVYSLGNIDLAKNDQGIWSESVKNLSGTFEGAEDVFIRAGLLLNEKEKFETASRLKSASIGVRCFTCSAPTNGYEQDSYLVWIQEFDVEVLDDSPSANIVAGQDLYVEGSQFINRASTVGAGRDIKITVNDFQNVAFALGGNVDYKYLSLTPGKEVWQEIANYNSYNDEKYNGDLRFWNSSGVESRVEPRFWTTNNKPIDRDLYQYFGTMRTALGGAYYETSYKNAVKMGPSLYSSGIRAEAPALIKNAKPFSEFIVGDDSGSAAQAVVQAGRNITISAANKVVNGIERTGISAQVSDSKVSGTSVSKATDQTVVSLHKQLPPDLQQQQINPLTLPGFSLPQGENGLFRLSGQEGTSSTASAAQGAGNAIAGTPVNAASLAVAGVQGLPVISRPVTGHKYLIETNPELTNLKQFLGSDYLLGNLGYTPDNTQKRLGDGLYEQRLIREAVVARTGQRFLAGLTSDEAMFRYLMDNAIASKQALNLSLGVTLTAAQVAALTHDIVWLEEYEVNGEKVLVPVLYLAQAKGRLAPNGALVQGQDVSLISGGDLLNQGTLRASNNLSAVAGGSVGNSGLIEAGNRLELLASESIRNAQGGIIAGRDLSLTALSGDVINERSVTRHEVEFGNRHNIQDFVDSAARIEAANSLSISAGRDVANLGGVFDSRGDLVISAGRDVTIASVEERSLQARGSRYLDEQVRQLGAQVSAGRDIEISAGRDLTAIASQIEARRDLALVAGGDVLLASAANEDHFYSKSKKVTRSTDKIVQQSTTVQAGRDIVIAAGEDVTLVASQVKAGNNIALDAEQDINILSAKDESASFYSKKSKGSFGRSKSEQKESYQSTNIASVIDAGNDLTLNTSKAADGSLSINGGRDITVIGSQLKAGNDLLVGATGDVAILSGVEEHGSYSKKTKSGFLGLSKSGKSQLKTTASQVASELEAGNDVVVAAGNDIRLRASETTAGNDVELRAGLVTDTGDINLVSANDTAYSHSERYSKKVGVSLSGGMLSIGSAKKAGEEARSSTSVGSQVAAERDAILQAERDINVIGSSVSAGRNLLIDAGRDINVLAAESQSASATSERTRHSGVDLNSDSNGFTAFVGNDVRMEKTLVTRNTAAASQLQAGIDLDLQAGRDINQTGSDMQAGRDINLGAIRNITLDAAAERVTNEKEEAGQRSGLTANMSHNFANTVDAIKGIGQGENIVSQVSSVLKAADSVTQFVSGPTTANHIGTTSQRTGTIEGVVSNRPSTLVAGRDVNLQAGNDIEVRGTYIQTQRDINMAARDITLDVARGEKTNVSEQTLSQSGINGGSTFNSSRVGIGGSHGTITEDGQRGTSLPTQLEAGRDVHLHADRDLSLIGTQVLAQRDIDLKAGNDLNIRAAQNDADYDMRRKSGGGEVGLALGGQDFISVYASVDIGKGKLDREGAQQQEAYLYAGKGLNFESGRDTTIAGARMEGEGVAGKVGRDLLVSSVTDTGKVSGKEFDASMTVSVGLYGSFSVSGSVGVGKTNGSTDWVQGQTAITARDRLDIRTENHTQLDGAVLASNTGNLKLDTNTLGFRDIEGHDREHAWYINAGGSYSSGGDNGPNAAATAAVVDTSQENKDGSNSWSLSGYDNRTEREQILRATVGLGEVVVRGDADTGRDSTAGLNRDVSQAFEITKDKKESTELYVSSSSLDAVTSPVETLQSWTAGVQNYGRNAVQAFVNMELLKTEALSAAENNKLVAALAWAPELLVNAMDAMNIPTLGIFPGPANYGGLFTQLPVLVTGDLRPVRVSGSFKTENGELVLVDGKPVVESQTVEKFEGFNNDDSIFTNGIMNSLTEALANGLMQAGNGSGNVDFVLAYNPTHGLIGDLVESAFDKNLSGSVLSGTARNLNDLFQGAVDAGPESLRIYGHSQGGLLTWVAVKGMDFSNVQMTSIQLSGAPVDAIQFHRDADAAGFKNDDQRVFQVNRPDESVFFGLLPKTDTVADLPVFLGGNSQYSDDPVKRALGALFTVTSLFAQDSPHSNYSCINCPTATPSNVNTQIRDIVIKPTLIDSQGNATRLP